MVLIFSNGLEEYPMNVLCSTAEAASSLIARIYGNSSINVSEVGTDGKVIDEDAVTEADPV